MTKIQILFKKIKKIQIFLTFSKNYSNFLKFSNKKFHLSPHPFSYNPPQFYSNLTQTFHSKSCKTSTDYNNIDKIFNFNSFALEPANFFFACRLKNLLSHINQRIFFSPSSRAEHLTIWIFFIFLGERFIYV